MVESKHIPSKSTVLNSKKADVYGSIAPGSRFLETKTVDTPNPAENEVSKSVALTTSKFINFNGKPDTTATRVPFPTEKSINNIVQTKVKNTSLPKTQLLPQDKTALDTALAVATKKETISSLEIKKLKEENSLLRSQLNETNTINSQLKNQLIESRNKVDELKNYYENHLTKLRSEFDEYINHVRTDVYSEVDTLLAKYNTLSKRAVELARRTKQRAVYEEEERNRAYEKSCKEFEQDCKNRVKGILDSYKFWADQNAEENEVKLAALEDKLVKVTKELHAEREKLENAVNDIAREKILNLETRYNQLEIVNEKMKSNYENNMQKFISDAKCGIKKIENQLIAACINILWTYNIEISEIEFRRVIGGMLKEFEEPQV